MKIIIVDDDILVRDGLKILIQSEEDMEVVAVAKDGQQAYDQVAKHLPDVVLMDIRMPDVDGIIGTALIKKDYPNTKILMLTTFKDDEYIAQAINNGAQGYMLKNQPSDAIINGIRTINSGASIYEREVALKLKGMIKSKKQKLSAKDLNLLDRQMEILALIADGYSNKEIAAKLFISDGTLRNYVTVLLDKLKLRDRTQLAIFYIKNIEQ